jgi:hypothetical protein
LPVSSTFQYVERRFADAGEIMTRLAVAAVAIALMSAGCKKEEEPTFPPEIPEATVTCTDASGQDYPVVEEIGVTIRDPDRDLVTDSIFVTANGLKLDEIADDDADDVFTWSPPNSWDPPMVCRGTFTIIAQATDTEGQHTKQTLEVEK